MVEEADSPTRPSEIESPRHEPEPPSDDGRRGFLASVSTLAMTAGLAGGYGFFAWIAARFLYPARPADKSWQFVTEANRLAAGESLAYRAPSGEAISVTRQATGGGADDFIALSSTCPHLGCQVHWEAQNNRYFCPCHNGVFDPSGRGTGGPPGDAGQSLPRYRLRVQAGLLYIEVPTERLATLEGECRGRRGSGHDPCLDRLDRRPPATRKRLG